MPHAIFPDKVLEIGQRQVQLLVEQSLLRPREDGDFEGDDSQMAMLTLIEHPSAMNCDFCGATPVHVEYPCEDFAALDTAAAQHGSIGAWMACDTCAGFIDAKDLSGLSDHAIAAYNETHELTDAGTQIAIDIMLRGLHKTFYDHRVGPGRRV